MKNNSQLILLGVLLGFCLFLIIDKITKIENIEYEKSKPEMTDEEKYQYARDKIGNRDPYIQPNVEETPKQKFQRYNRFKNRDRELDRYIDDYIEENHEEIIERYLDR